MPIALLPVVASAIETEGAVLSWGDNGSGQLGRAGTGGQSAGAVNAEQVVGLAGGRAHSVAVLADGSLKTWGDNSSGQLGDNSLTTQSTSPVAVAIVDGTTRKSVRTAAAGADHVLALTSDGQVWGWGLNTSAQLGLDPDRLLTTRVPRRIAIDLPAGVTVTDVAAGDNFSLALASNGVVYGWGDNFRGQLGPVFSEDEAAKLTLLPTRIGITGVTAIGAGAGHSLAITTGGQVYTWGENNKGQLRGAPAGPAEPLWSQVPLPAGAGSPVAVDGGRSHSLALLADGRVLAWGDNGVGQLGHPATVTTGSPNFVPAVKGVTQLDSRTDATIAVEAFADKTGAAVWTWGDNAKGQLGHAVAVGNAPATVNVADTAITAASGDLHSLVAVAPRANVSATTLTFPSTVEVGTTSAAMSVSVTNGGPGALRFGAVSFQAGESDFAFAPNGDGCSNKTLAANGSCTVSVVFKPVAAGPRSSYLVIDHDGFGGDPRIDLVGQALVLSGGIGITTAPENVSSGVPSSPSAVPLGDIPLQPNSPAIADEQKTGGLPLGDVIGIGGLPLGDVIGIGGLPLGDVIGIGGLPLGDVIGIGGLPLGDVIGIGGLPLGDVIGISPRAAELLSGISLATLPLGKGYAWDGDNTADPKLIISGSPSLHGQPLQGLTLLDALSDATAAARFRAVPIQSVGWATSRLGGVGVLAVLLGNNSLRQITGQDFCPQLDAAGAPDCGAGYGKAATAADGLSATPFEYDMAGIPLGSLNLASVKLGQIADRSAPVFSLVLDRIDLYRSDLGSLPATDAVVDCTKTNCSTATLATAQGARAIKPGATVGDLSGVADMSLGRLMAGLLPLGDNAYGRVPLDRMGILGYGGSPGRDTHKVDYTATFANSSGSALPSGTTMTVKLPKGFIFVNGTARMSVKNASGQVVAAPVVVGDPSYAEQRFTFSVPGTLPVANGNTLVLTFSARPGIILGTFTVDEVSIQTPTKKIATTTPSAPVRVVDGLEANNTPATATPITTSEMKVSHISSAQDRDFFSFDAAGIAPGSMLAVHLDHQQGGDADLLVYGAPGMKGEAPLRTPSARGITPLAEHLPAINGIGTSLPADVQSDIHRDMTLPLLGISQNRDAVSEVVTALALTPATANDKYVLEVAGYNGSFANTPYSIRVSVIPPAAVPVAPAKAFPFPADPTATVGANTSFTGINTLFLTANSRMQRQFGTTGLAQVTAALKDTRMAGIIGKFGVLSVDTDEAVKQAYASWDANPADPVKANNVVRAINALVDRAVLPNTTALQNIVLVGNDDILPMARIADLTATVNERTYAREVASRTSPANALVGAAVAGRFLSDDPYGDLDPTPMPGEQYLYLSGIALGRLVDTPSQIAGVLNQFMQFNGVVDPKSALTTSAAGFLDDLAEQVDAALAGKNVTRSKLTTGGWGRAELKSAWTSAASAPGIVSFNGHSDPSRTGTRAAQESGDLFSTADVATANLAGELVLTVGCHTGLPVADGVLKFPTGQSWASSLMSRGAAGYLSQTGYGLGSKSTVALTEKVVLGFVKSMGTTSLGNSLVVAKQAYADEGGPADMLDAKALMEATYYGMPQLRFATAVAGPPPAPALPTGVDAVTGLATGSLKRQSTDPSAPGYFAFQKNVTPDGTYYSIDGRTLSVSGRPVQPLLTTDVSRPGMRAHGIVFNNLTSVDDAPPFDPVLPRPVATGMASTDDELQVGDVAFPAALQSIRTNSGKDVGAIVPALFQSTGVVNGKTVGNERRFTSLDATVLYAPVTDTDFTPPTVLSARAVTTTVGDAVTFSVDAPEAKDVTVLFKEDGKDAWRLLRLARSGTGRWSGGTTVSATKVEYFVQAVDASGNVGVMADKGRLLKAEPIGASLPGSVQVKVMGTPAPGNTTGDTSGWLRTATVSLVPTDPSLVVTVRVDGGPEVPASVVEFAGDGVANPPAKAILGDGYHTISYTASDGTQGVVVVRIDNAGPSISITSPKEDGSTQLVTGQSATAAFRCTDAASGVGSCTATVNGVPVAQGGALPTDIKPDHLFVVSAQDLAGNTSGKSATYSVGYRFEGFFEPVLNRPAVNHWSAGQTVPIKYRLFDAAGNNISSTSTFVGAGSFEFACAAPPPAGSTPGSAAGTQSGLVYAGDKFQYGWATQKGWKSTCRRFVLRLNDGSHHLADFQFS